MASKGSTTTQPKQPNRGSAAGAGAEAGNATAVVKRKPVFIKVHQLQPGSSGNNVVVKVVDSNLVLNKKPRNLISIRGPTSQLNSRISECLVGDETGAILFTARNDQVDLMKPDNTVILRNAKIDMFKGTMRLAVDKWGRIEVTEPADFVVEVNKNLSLVEYELVTVADES